MCMIIIGKTVVSCFDLFHLLIEKTNFEQNLTR